LMMTSLKKQQKTAVKYFSFKTVAFTFKL